VGINLQELLGDQGRWVSLDSLFYKTGTFGMGGGGRGGNVSEAQGNDRKVQQRGSKKES